MILALSTFCGFMTIPMDVDRPNIIFIEVDDLTAKYLGALGAPFAQTPCVDELINNGVYFENAVAQGTMCTPSRNSVITGLYPHNLGMYHNLDIKELPKGIWTFPKELNKLGYTTFWVGKNHLLPNYKGIKANNAIELRNKGMRTEMGFDFVQQSMGRAVILNKLLEHQEKCEPWNYGQDEYGDFLHQNNLLDTFYEEGGNVPTTLDENSQYMDGYFTSVALQNMEFYKSDKPFFMWINFSGPHIPFDPPKNYIDMFSDRDMPEPIDSVGVNYQFPDELIPIRNTKTKNGILNYRKRYKGAIAYMDTQVGRILDFIENSERHKNTIIVFFSDHGIMTGDHGIMGKETLYKEVLNPSLVFYYPKKFKAKKITTAVELLDLGKTTLAIAKADEVSILRAPYGHSLLPLLKGIKGFTGPGYGVSEVTNYRSIFNGQYKYINHPTNPILFNLRVDPDELQNRIVAEPNMAVKLKRAMEDWLKTAGEVIPGPTQVTKNHED